MKYNFYTIKFLGKYESALPENMKLKMEKYLIMLEHLLYFDYQYDANGIYHKKHLRFLFVSLRI
jgi:hypothetical protein